MHPITNKLESLQAKRRDMIASLELNLVKQGMESGTPYEARYRAAGTRLRNKIAEVERQIKSLERRIREAA